MMMEDVFRRGKAKKQRDPERMVAHLAAYMLNAILVTEFFEFLCVALHLPSAITTVIRLVVRDGGYILSFLLTIRCVWKKLRLEFLLLPLFFVAALCVTLFLVPSYQNTALWNPVILLFLRCLPLYMLTAAISDYRKVVRACIPYIFVAIAHCILYVITLAEDISNYMTFSYSLLIPVLVSLILMFEWKRVYFLPAAFLMVVIMLYGARGPLLCIGVSGIAMLIVSLKRMTPFKVVMIMLGFLALCTVALLWTQIMQLLMQLYPDSRTLYILQNLTGLEEIATGRADIYEAGLELLNKNPLFGYGIMRDRYYLSRQLGFSDYQEGITPHNLILEFALQYGVILGIVLFFLLLALYILTFRRIRKKPSAERMFIESVIISSFLQLMVSSSYLESYLFWFGLGICITTMIGKRPHTICGNEVVEKC